MILSEFSRIADHLVCIGTNLVDLGSISNFWYGFRPREEIYDLIESCCGGRLTVSYVRIGGVADDIPDDFVTRARQLLESIPKYVDDIEKMNRHNKIFKMRTEGITAISAEDAIDWGFTGPVLRACGVPYDIRKWFPNYDYDKFEFDDSRSASAAMSTIAISCASKKFVRACGSFDRRWRTCRKVRCRSRIAASACRRRRASIRTSKI